MAGFDIGSVYAKIDADISGFKKGMDQVKELANNTGITKLAEGIKETANQASILIGVLGAGISIFSKSSIDEYEEAIYLNTKLTEVIMNRKGATKEDVEMLKEQAQALEEVGVISADSIVSAQAQLATFDFTADAISKVIPSFLNLAIAEEGVNIGADQMKQLANGLGKAMQGNTELFTKQGFVITDLQKEILKTGNEMERVETIAEILGNTYDGLNESMAQTFTGNMAKARINIDNFKESIGQFLSTALNPLVGKFNEWFSSGSFTWFVEKLGEASILVNQLMQGNMGGLASFFNINPELFNKFVGVLQSFSKWIAENQALVMTFVTGLGVGLGALLVLGTINMLIMALLNPMTLLVLAVAGLYTAWETNFLGIQTVTKAVLDWFFNTFYPEFNNFWNNYIKPIITGVVNFIKENWTVISGTTNAIWQVISGFVQFWWSIIYNLIKAGLALFTGDWVAFWDALAQLTDGAWEGMKKMFNGWIDFIKTWGAEIGGWIRKPFDDAYNAIKGKMAEIRDAIDFTKRHSPSVIDIINRGVGQANKALGGLSMGFDMNPSLNHASTQSTNSSMVNIRIDMAGAFIGDEYSASSMAESMGDSIIKKLQSNLRI